MIVSSGKTSSPYNQAVFLAHLFQIGFVLENPERFSNDLLTHYPRLMDSLIKMRGGHVPHVPLYANFPDEVPEPDEYFLSRLLGYVLNHSRWDVPGKKVAGVTVPKWLFDLELFGADPISQRQDLRLFLREKFRQLLRKGEKPGNPTVLKFVDLDQAWTELSAWVRWCLTSKTSFPEFYRQEIEAALRLLPDLGLEPEEITFREHRAVYSAHLWRASKWKEVARFCRYPTDLLRMLVHLEGQDVSLSEPVRFPKLKRVQRRHLLSMLNEMGCGRVMEDQLRKYRGLWLALERSLHSGEYKDLFPSAYRLLSLLREDKLRPRFSELEQAYAEKDEDAVLRILSTFPGGVTLRRFCQTLALSSDTLNRLMPQIKAAPLKDQITLNQVLERDASATEAIILTKRGATQVIPRRPQRISAETRRAAVSAVSESLFGTVQSKYGGESWLGKGVFIDPGLESWTVPTSLRSASDGLLLLGRGTVVELGGKQTLRMFVYWKQHFRSTDLDLSAVTFDESFRCTGQVSWTNLRSSGLVHSGDLQSAPFGAAEFIDADLDVLKRKGHRYLGLLVYRFCGEYFSEMECFTGWMMRDKPNASYKTFDIASVEQKLLLAGEATYALPVLFDTHRRQALWLDLRVYGTEDRNSVEGSWGNVERLVRVGRQMSVWKLDLSQLASLHARARGATIVESREAADISFTVDGQGDFHPGNWTKILSQLL